MNIKKKLSYCLINYILYNPISPRTQSLKDKSNITQIQHNDFLRQTTSIHSEKNTTFPQMLPISETSSFSERSSTSLNESLKHFHSLTEEELNKLKRLSTKQILLLYQNLISEALIISRFYLLKKKYTHLLKKENSEINKKRKKQYKYKLKEIQENIKIFFETNETQLKLLKLAAKSKKIILDKELIELSINCIKKFVNPNEKINRELTKNIYYKKDLIKNHNIDLNSRLNYLQNKIKETQKEKIKETNIIFENHYPHESSSLYQIKNEHSHHIATYHDLIQQSYLAQLNLQKMFQNGTSEYEIEKYKKHVITINKRAKKYFEENGKTFIEYIEIKFAPKYCENVFFCSDFLKEQIKFMQNSENHMDLILRNNTPFFLKRCIQYLEEKDNHTNKIIKKILKKILHLNKLNQSLNF